MNHRHDVRTRLVDFAVDETLEVDGPAVGVQGRSIEIEFDDVLRLHASRRHVASEQEPVGVLVVAHAHMAEGIQHALVEQDVVGRHQIGDQGRVGWLTVALAVGGRLGESVLLVRCGHGVAKS